MEKKYGIQDFSMGSVKACLVVFRREFKYTSWLRVYFPPEAENSIGFLRKCFYDIDFVMSLNLKDKEILITETSDNPYHKKNVV